MMDYIANQQMQIEEMLALLKISSVDELFRCIPKELLVEKLPLDDGMSEYEGMNLMQEIASNNIFSKYSHFLGAGAYDHHVPALVSFICSKSEFMTSYTPYQPEASQGMLQAIFEYQSVVCALTEMDLSNASLYDGASACAEACLMALRQQKNKNRIVVAGSLHPHYRAVVEQVVANHGTKIEYIPFDQQGKLDTAAAMRLIDTSTAAVLVQYPNFFGTIDDLKPVLAHSKAQGALGIVCANPLVYGIYTSARQIGADIAVGDCQPFGLPLQFGGPYVGYIACTQELMRQMPGRIVGETVDLEGNRGYVLTLQAREQHIRREKATSNVCTNQALAALAVLVAVLWYGKEGVKKLALTNYQRTAYLRSKLKEISGVTILGDLPFLNEFALSFNRPFTEVEEHFRRYGILPGVNLGQYYPEFDRMLLVAVTEKKSKAQLDAYVEAAKALCKK